MELRVDNRAIGVFDSGLGGLTAVRELTALMPNEDIIYFGDTGRVPYGTKGHDTIIKYASQDIRFLLGFDVKAIVIACGSVSSTALEQACAMSPVPVLGVLNPAVKSAVAKTKSGRIGVLGTSATIRSGSFEKKILNILPNATVKNRACPMFVPLVENGYFQKGNNIAHLIAEEYLQELKGQVDTLILGCTHYPLLNDVIADIMGKDVELIDAGKETAIETAKLLAEQGILCKRDSKGCSLFFVSDCTDDFARLAGIFLKQPINNVKKIEIDKY
jgi:glutamate racemase